MNLPTDIDEWDLGTITNILHDGVYETDTLEFKENLLGENNQIPKTVCAFSNANGGVIIFGVSDDRSKHAFERCIGLPKSVDNVLTISNQIRNIMPQLSLKNVQFIKTPISLNQDKEILVIKITPSEFLHQYEDKFWKRIHGRNESMPYDEIITKIIERRKNLTIIHTLKIELSVTRFCTNFIETATIDDLSSIFDYANEIHTDAMNHFLFDYSYLYDEKIVIRCSNIIEIIRKLQGLEISYGIYKEASSSSEIKTLLGKSKTASIEEYVTKTGNNLAHLLMQELQTLEIEMNFKIPQAKENKYDFFGMYKN